MERTACPVKASPHISDITCANQNERVRFIAGEMELHELKEVSVLCLVNEVERRSALQT